jgi:hypothetical protein
LLYRPKITKGGYNFKVEQERYVFPSFIWLELEENRLRFYNRFTGTYHKFTDGSTMKELGKKTLTSLKRKIEADMKCGDEFRIRDIKTD